MSAITLALIGHSGLDEDKCLGLGWESVEPTGFHVISERDGMFRNGSNWFRVFKHITGLLSITSHNMSFLPCHAYKQVLKFHINAAACAFERAKRHEAP